METDRSDLGEGAGRGRGLGDEGPVSHNLTFKEWIEQEASLVDSDGCSFASGFYKFRCRMHDLEYRYAKDAADAYQNYLSGILNPWHHAKAITRGEADTHLIHGIRNDSPLGYLDPIGFVRLLVKPFGRWPWKKHRAREQRALRAAME